MRNLGTGSQAETEGEGLVQSLRRKEPLCLGETHAWVLEEGERQDGEDCGKGFGVSFCFFLSLSLFTEHPSESKKHGVQSKSKEFNSVQLSHSVVSDSLQPHGLQHARLPCPSPASGAYSNSYPLSHLCHPTISSSVVPLSSCLQSFPASGPFQMSQFFTSGGQSIGVSASTSVLPQGEKTAF